MGEEEAINLFSITLSLHNLKTSYSMKKKVLQVKNDRYQFILSCKNKVLQVKNGRFQFILSCNLFSYVENYNDCSTEMRGQQVENIFLNNFVIIIQFISTHLYMCLNV
jgi:hypothetical protein